LFVKYIRLFLIVLKATYLSFKLPAFTQAVMSADAADAAFVRNDEVVRLMIVNQFNDAERRCEAALDRPRIALFHAQIAFARVVLTNTPAVIEEALARAWKAEKLAADALAKSNTGYLSSWMGALGLSNAPVQVHRLLCACDNGVWSLTRRGCLQTAAQVNAQLDLELVQADCYLLGSMAQLLLGSYVKGCVNLRAAWCLFSLHIFFLAKRFLMPVTNRTAYVKARDAAEAPETAPELKWCVVP
jgi:hypothetical protein